MALQSSGQLSLSDVNVELGLSSSTTINMNSTVVRDLYEVASGAIRLGVDGYGKADYDGAIESLSGYTDATAIINGGYGVEYTSSTSSGVFIVPSGITSINVEISGGGSSSYCRTVWFNWGNMTWTYQYWYAGRGYKSTNTGLSVSENSSISVVVGASGSGSCHANNGNSCSSSGGGSSSFGSYYSESGGTGCSASSANPQNNAPGSGSGYSSPGQGGDEGGSQGTGFVRITWSAF